MTLPLRYLSVCSGIESATVAWQPFEWQAVAFSEIEPYPCALLKHHYPDVPNWGDMTKFKEWPDANVDLLVGGTPCQSFSVAGLRGGLDDPRGNLMLTYLAIAGRYRPKWLVWENVPGVLSSNSGKDFGSFLGGLAELGYGFAYRVLDAQYYGVAQRRRRVFVVGCLGDWRRAAAVLFERHSLSGHPAPSREARESAAPPIAPSLRGQSQASHRLDTAPTLVSNGDAHSEFRDEHGLVYGNCLNPDQPQCWRVYDPEGLAPSLQSGEARGNAINIGMAVRRLTPVECERLQGFPDGYTNVPFRGKPVTDGHRYKALGNSKAVPVVRWIGERIAAVERIST